MNTITHIIVKKTQNIASLLVCVAVVSSCHTWKRTTSVNSVRVAHDSVMVHDTVAIAVHDSVNIERYVRDTVYEIAAQDINLTLNNGQGTDTTIKKKSLKLHVYNDSKGKQHIDCDADSLTLVISNLVRENVYRGYQLDSISMSTSVSKAYDSSTTVKEIVA